MLATWLGVLPTLWISVAGQGLSVLPVALSPLLRMRELPGEQAAADAVPGWTDPAPIAARHHG